METQSEIISHISENKTLQDYFTPEMNKAKALQIERIKAKFKQENDLRFLKNYIQTYY